MTGILIEGEKLERQRGSWPREDEGKIWMQPQTREQLEQPEAARHEGSFPRSFRGSVTLSTP